MPVAILPRQLRGDGSFSATDPISSEDTVGPTLVAPAWSTPSASITWPLPTITAPPPCCEKANEAIVQLTTTLTISDYNRYYGGSPNPFFVPTYYALPDGSLVTSSYISELREAYTSLVFLSALAVIFVRNIVVSGGYIRRGKIKKKGLFYLLFASQLLGPVVLLPFLISHFSEHVDCDVVFLVASTACFISIWILVTGILGIKAYLCLDRSRVVIVILAIIQVIWLSIAVDELTDTHSQRLPVGGCDRDPNGMIHVFVITQCVQAVFISVCFIYAVWKSSGVPAARSRISLQLSMDDLRETTDSHWSDGHPDDDSNHMGRGWWDYVPSSEKPPSSLRGGRFRFSRVRDIFRHLSISIRRPWSTRESSPDLLLVRKSSIPGDVPIPQPTRPSAVRISGNDHRENPRSQSPMPSLSIYRSGLIPRMVLCREVMRDELYYTTFIAATCVVVTVFVVIGVNKAKVWSFSSWLMLNWTIISLLAVHSFGRVVRRHEIEEMRQHPWSWNPNFRADQRQQARTRHPWSPPHSITSHRLARRNVTTTNSYNHDHDVSGSETRLYLPSGADDLLSVHALSTAETSLCSHAPSIYSSLKVPLHHEAGITPSPFSDDFRFSSSSSSPIETNTEPILFTPHDLLVHDDPVR